MPHDHDSEGFSILKAIFGDNLHVITSAADLDAILSGRDPHEPTDEEYDALPSVIAAKAEGRTLIGSQHTAADRNVTHINDPSDDDEVEAEISKDIAHRFLAEVEGFIRREAALVGLPSDLPLCQSCVLSLLVNAMTATLRNHALGLNGVERVNHSVLSGILQPIAAQVNGVMHGLNHSGEENGDNAAHRAESDRLRSELTTLRADRALTRAEAPERPQ